MAETRCTHCGSNELEPGFFADRGDLRGCVTWISGRLERGIFGGVKRRGRTRRYTIAHRCLRCSHLELFATDQV